MIFLRQSNNGRIIVISSIWGETGASLETIYSAMKSAQIGFVKALSQKLATSVTVNAITPGMVKGKMSDVWSKDELSNIVAELPQQQRMIDPSEVAHAWYTCVVLCQKYNGNSPQK